VTVWFVSRHRGAVEWARRQGLAVDRLVDHLDPARVEAGDVVVGTLPIHLAAEVCDKGARYVHLSLEVPRELRGRELTADELSALGARLEEYHVRRCR